MAIQLFHLTAAALLSASDKRGLIPSFSKRRMSQVGSFCVFANLSVRLPGIFRFRMTLYEMFRSVDRREIGHWSTRADAVPTCDQSFLLFPFFSFPSGSSHVCKMGSVVTEPFEVFSPKVRIVIEAHKGPPPLTHTITHIAALHRNGPLDGPHSPLR